MTPEKVPDRYRLRLLGSSVLDAPCKPVEEFNDALKEFVHLLFQENKRLKGFGLSANQLGVRKQVAVIEIPELEGKSQAEKFCLVNPVIVRCTEPVRLIEGCLSIPEFFENVQRWNSVTVRYQDELGVTKETSATGVLAQCIQHECDHLAGRLMLHLVRSNRRGVRRRAERCAQIAASHGRGIRS